LILGDFRIPRHQRLKRQARGPGQLPSNYDLARRMALYAGVLIGIPSISLASSLLLEAVGGEGLGGLQIPWWTFLGVILQKGNEGPFEEFGWRGFALPLLQRRCRGITSAIVLGFIWALRHVSGFFVSSVLMGALAGSL
jgi:hypothetical protein